MNIPLLLLTLAAATAGALAFTRLKIPAGGLLGAMFFVIMLNIFTGKVFFPEQARPVVQVIAGAFIGVRMKKSDVVRMKALVFPAVLLVFGMLALNLSLGFGIHLLTGLELSTALLGAAPGGIQDMVLIADALGANTAQITIFHVFRVFAVIGIMPVLIRVLSKKYQLAPVKKEPEIIGPAKEPGDERVSEDNRQKTLDYLRTLAFAVAGGFLVSLTPVPAGALIGAMFGTVFASLAIRASRIPRQFRMLLQVGAGALIGSRIGLAEVKSLADIIVPTIMLVLVLLIASVVFGILIHKIAKLDLLTCLFASAAGGLADMAIVAEEMGADSPKVVVLQFARLVCVVSLFPSIFQLFL